MLNQTEFPWHESAEDATSAAIHKSGRAIKGVAAELWPAMKMESAYATLRAALNPDQPRKLTADEHIKIATLCGQYDFLYYCAQECHHTRPDPVTPEDARCALQIEFNQSVKELSSLAERIRRLT